MLKITDIYPESIAEEMELEVGDALVSIDGKPVRDLLDYTLYCGRRSELILDVLRRDGEQWELHIEREPHEDLGMEFEHPDQQLYILLRASASPRHAPHPLHQG
jgi:NifB/MoaA-like Fe-S oxidoreductase